MNFLNIQKQNFFIGAKWSWSESISNFPSSTYDAKCFLKNSNYDTITITATANSDNQQFDFEKEATTGLAKGNYKWQILIYNSGGSVPIKIFEGSIYIDTTLDAETDARTFAEKQLATLQTAYENRAGDDFVIKIKTDGGKEIEFTNAEALRNEMKVWAEQVKRERSIRNNTFQKDKIRVLNIN